MGCKDTVIGKSEFVTKTQFNKFTETQADGISLKQICLKTDIFLNKKYSGACPRGVPGACPRGGLTLVFSQLQLLQLLVPPFYEIQSKLFYFVNLGMESTQILISILYTPKFLFDIIW